MRYGTIMSDNKKDKTFLYFGMLCCVALIFLFFFVFAARCFGQYVLVDTFGVSTEHPLVDLLLKKREKNAMEMDESDIFLNRGTLSAIQAYIGKETDAFERLVEDYLIGRDTCVFIVNRVEAMLGFRMGAINEENLIALEDGYLLEPVNLQTEEQIRQTADILVDLRDMLAEHGIPLVYAKKLQRACVESDWVCGALDFSMENSVRERSYLYAKGVDVLCLEEMLHAEGLDHHGMFYRTDHHWNAQAGLWVADLLAKHGQSNYGLQFDRTKLMPAEYYTDTIELGFLGSYGRRVTLAKASPEQFDFMYPISETDIGFWVNSKEKIERGDFSVLYDMSYLEYKQTTKNFLYESEPYSSTCYGAFLKGDVGVCGIENHMNETGPRVLLIGDSFDNIVAPFLSLACSEVIVVDPRLITRDIFETEVLVEPFDIAYCTIDGAVERIVYTNTEITS